MKRSERFGVFGSGHLCSLVDWNASKLEVQKRRQRVVGFFGLSNSSACEIDVATTEVDQRVRSKKTAEFRR